MAPLRWKESHGLIYLIVIERPKAVGKKLGGSLCTKRACQPGPPARSRRSGFPVHSCTQYFQEKANVLPCDIPRWLLRKGFLRLGLCGYNYGGPSGGYRESLLRLANHYEAAQSSHRPTS